MAIPIVFAAILSLLTTSAEKPLCCYATERGWIVYALGSPDIHVLRPHKDEGFVERTVLLSSKLAPSNLKNHKMAALVIDDRLVLEYAYDFGGGWLPRNGSIDTGRVASVRSRASSMGRSSTKWVSRPAYFQKSSITRLPAIYLKLLIREFWGSITTKRKIKPELWVGSKMATWEKKFPPKRSTDCPVRLRAISSVCTGKTGTTS